MLDILKALKLIRSGMTSSAVAREMKVEKQYLFTQLNNGDGMFYRKLPAQFESGKTEEEVFTQFYVKEIPALIEEPKKNPEETDSHDQIMVLILDELRVISDLLRQKSEIKQAKLPFYEGVIKPKRKKKPESAYCPDNLNSPEWSSDDLKTMTDLIENRPANKKVSVMCRELVKLFPTRGERAIASRYYKTVRDKEKEISKSKA